MIFASAPEISGHQFRCAKYMFTEVSLKFLPEPDSLIVERPA